MRGVREWAKRKLIEHYCDRTKWIFECMPTDASKYTRIADIGLISVCVVGMTRVVLIDCCLQIVKDEPLKELLRRKVKMRQPYVGVFVKRDDEYVRFILPHLRTAFTGFVLYFGRSFAVSPQCRHS